VIAIGAGEFADVGQRAELAAHGLAEFRITFGSAHAGQTLDVGDGDQEGFSPVPGIPVSDPDGWLTVYAPDETAARNAVHDVIGGRWSDCYPESPWWPRQADLYPLGELAAWVVTEPTQVGS
jgi:hypothetical protein